ncbi:hypothetical protein SCLARK_001472 [Spiroplasma clarkii]|uniref:hypothetical protein n=1 Tax=Spiroplasma clarkii TaxID=2139 RepID=UPI000B56858E|nr:hypothetical protein [Spiroplasma clarkii]ARU91989.1 hypothetical protein SCLARK_001472 [Spiroplasma clarkii]
MWNKNVPTLENWEDDNIKYELFGETFDSKIAAVEYFVSKKTTVNKSENYKNEIILGNKDFTSISGMLNHIESESSITKVKTYKDPKMYLTDSLGSISADGVVNKEDIVNAYKDSNGNAVYSGSDEKSKIDVLNSYTNKIQNGFEADGKFFQSKEQLVAYYQNKFEGEKIKLSKKQYHKLGNFWYEKGVFEKSLEKSIVKSVEYNNQVISEENKFNLSGFKVKDSDLDKILKLEKKPGMYYLEADPNDDGTLQIEGGNYQKTTNNVSELIKDKNNWTLISKSTSGLADEVFNTVSNNLVSALGSMSYYDNMLSSSGGSLLNNFASTVEVYFDKLAKFLEVSKNDSVVTYGMTNYLKNSSSLKKSSSGFKGVLEKYQLDQEIDALWNGLAPMKEMEQNKKVIVVLYNIRELLRSVDISKPDAKIMEEFMYNSLLSLNINFFGSDSKRTNHGEIELSDKWVEVIETAKASGKIYEVLDLLMNPNNLSSVKSKGLAQTYNNYLKDAVISLKDVQYWAKKIHDIRDTMNDVSENFKKLTKKLKKALVWVDLAINLINMIPGKTTENWEFVIPDTKNKVTYQRSSWFWDVKEFNPKNIVQTLEISKPKDTITYLYNEKYFTSYNDALYRLKRDIIDDLFADPSKVRYVSKYFEHMYNIDKNKLISLLMQQTDKKNAYSDGFGETFSNQSEAVNSAIRKIASQKYIAVFKYDFQGNYIYGYDYNEVYDRVVETVDLQGKAVEFTDYLSTNNFEKLENVDNDGYDLYKFFFNGKNYYFDDYNGAIVKYMQLNDFRNSLIQINASTYELNGIIFYNINQLTDYLLNNVKEVA